MIMESAPWIAASRCHVLVVKLSSLAGRLSNAGETMSAFQNPIFA